MTGREGREAPSGSGCDDLDAFLAMMGDTRTVTALRCPECGWDTGRTRLRLRVRSRQGGDMNSRDGLLDERARVIAQKVAAEAELWKARDLLDRLTTLVRTYGLLAPGDELGVLEEIAAYQAGVGT